MTNKFVARTSGYRRKDLKLRLLRELLQETGPLHPRRVCEEMRIRYGTKLSWSNQNALYVLAMAGGFAGSGVRYVFSCGPGSRQPARLEVIGFNHE